MKGTPTVEMFQTSVMFHVSGVWGVLVVVVMDEAVVSEVAVVVSRVVVVVVIGWVVVVFWRVVEGDVEEVTGKLSVVAVGEVVLLDEPVAEEPLEPSVQPLMMTNPEIRNIRRSNETFFIVVPP
jgi:hypothetical protein